MRNNKGQFSKKHGYKNTRIYNIWCSMKQRCDDKNSTNYSNYGSRGIKYNKKWSEFEGFFEDMSKGYSKNKSLDRIDNNKGYYKENCRWATTKEQANNTRVNLHISYQGEIKTLSEWCDEFNLKYVKTWLRLYRYHWSLDRAFS